VKERKKTRDPFMVRVTELHSDEVVLRVKRRLPPTLWHVVPEVLLTLVAVMRFARPPERDPLAPKVVAKKTKPLRPLADETPEKG
jgi:hypothetical protein